MPRVNGFQFFFLILLSVSRLPASAVASSSVEIEVDPIAYALSGYSGHIGYVLAEFKFDFGAAKEKFSDSATKAFLGNQGFSSQFESVGAKLDFVGATQTGLHMGLQWDRSRWTYTATSSQTSANNTVQTVGPRIGYRIGPGRFYLDPWIAFLAVASGRSHVAVGTQTYQPQKFVIFPTVHLGIRF